VVLGGACHGGCCGVLHLFPYLGFSFSKRPSYMQQVQQSFCNCMFRKEEWNPVLRNI
jgi:hypothetical protein